MLYFVDSMGSMDEICIVEIVNFIKKYWSKEIGIYIYDNMGKVLFNFLVVYKNGVVWIDFIVIGMGWGFGNVRIEEIIIEFELKINWIVNIVFVLSIIRIFFELLKKKCGWGLNLFYFFIGKYSIYLIYV